MLLAGLLFDRTSVVLLLLLLNLPQGRRGLARRQRPRVLPSPDLELPLGLPLLPVLVRSRVLSRLLCRRLGPLGRVGVEPLRLVVSPARLAGLGNGLFSSF